MILSEVHWVPIQNFLMLSQYNFRGVWFRNKLSGAFNTPMGSCMPLKASTVSLSDVDVMHVFILVSTSSIHCVDIGEAAIHNIE